MAMTLNMMFLFLIFVCQLLPSPGFEALPTSMKPAGVVRAKPAAVAPVSRKGAKGSATSRSDSVCHDSQGGWEGLFSYGFRGVGDVPLVR